MSIYHCSTKKEGCPMWLRKFTLVTFLVGGFNDGVDLSESYINDPHVLLSIVLGAACAFGTYVCWCMITNKEKLLD